MTPESTGSTDRQERLSDILLGYMDAVQAGESPDREMVLAGHPEFRTELTEFFAGYDHLDRLAAPLRAAVDSGSAATMLLHGPAAPRPESVKEGESLGQLGDFRLLRELGRGGMGVVYEAEQISLRRRVALKMLPFAAALDPRQLQRFRNEAQAAAQLHHPGIVPVYAVGVERGVHYYAMQFIEGQSLAALIGELRQPAAAGSPTETTAQAAATISRERSGQGRRYFQRVARLGKEAAEALEHAHQLGVVHRDVKPANLLLDTQGRLWVADFGLAQFRQNADLTQTGELLGTLRYASPEQTLAQRGLADHRSDIYSLGATLYELLTLRPVFDGRDHHVLLRQIADAEPAPPRQWEPSVPLELETIVLKCLAKVPAERYATAQELADDLQRFLDDQPVLARRPTLLQRAAKWSRRHRGVVASALAFLVLALIGLTISNVRTQAAYERERRKVLEADESFRQARRVVDFLTQISEEELAQSPHLQGVRRRMLETALTYYQDFIDQRQDDPTLRAELNASRARVARILGELSALQGHAQFLLLNAAPVQEDLQVDEEQKQQIAELSGRMAEQGRSTFREFVKLSAAERQQKLVELAVAHEREAAGILTPGQSRRLRQIALQVHQRGPHGFRDPQVIDALKLTTKQREQIRKIQEEAGVAMMGFFPMPGGPPGSPPKKSDDPWKNTLEKVLALLTDEQKAAWRELTGEPFHGVVPLMMPVPGPKGPFPRPPGPPR